MKFDIRKLALLISLIGLAVSIYLVIVQYSSVPLICPDTGLINCGNVLTSQYSKVLGIPNSVLGVAFFLIEIIAVLKYFGKDEMVAVNAVGLAFVAYYVFAEYMIGNICLYCTVVHASVILLLIISIAYHGKKVTSSS